MSDMGLVPTFQSPVGIESSYSTLSDTGVAAVPPSHLLPSNIRIPIDELSIEQEAEKEVGWLLKTILFATAAAAGYQFFRYMDQVLASLHRAGAISIIESAPNSLEDAEVERLKLSLMKRFQDLRLRCLIMTFRRLPFSSVGLKPDMRE